MKTTLQLLFSLCLLFLTINLNAQNWNWANSLGSVTGDDTGIDMVLDNQGNTYITGRFQDTIITPVDTIISLGGNDIFIAKYDSIGDLLWLRSGGSTGSTYGFFSSILEEGNSIDIDKFGNVYISGGFVNTLTFDTITVVNTPNTYSSFLVKYDAAGNIQWLRTGVTTSSSNFFYNIPVDMVIDTFGNIYIAVIQRGDLLTFDGINVTTVIAGQNANTYLIKFDNNGNALYVNLLSFSGSTTIVLDKIQISDNQLYALYADNNQHKVEKYNLQGISLGVTSTLISANSSTSNFFAPSNLEILANGEILTYGIFSGTITINGASYTNTISTTRNLILAQFDNSGVSQWVKVISGGGNELGNGLSIDNMDNIYIAGMTNSSSINIDTTVIPLNGQNLFVAKFDDNGDLIWIQIDQNSAMPNAAVVSGIGDVYVTGEFSNTINFGDNQIQSSNSFSNIFVAKLDCKPQPISEVLGDTLVCLGSSTYEVVKNSIGNTFIWTLSGGGTVTNNGSFATINWTQTGVFTIIITQVNECGIGEPFSFDVRVKDVPNLPIINGDLIDCLGSATYNITNNDLTDTYAWTVSGGGNLFPIGNTAIVNWAITGTHVLSVSTSNLCGASPIGDLSVNIFEIPSQPTPITGNTNVCQSTQTYTIPQVNNVNYTWSLSSGGSITSNGNTATINWTTAGTHTLSITPFNDCGVGSARSVLVTVTETPQQPSTVVGNLTVCQGLQSYSVIGNTSTSYNWTISGGGTINASNDNATVNWTTSGIHTMTITPSNICGTGTPRTVTVTVLDVPNQPNLILGIDTVCIGTQNYSVAPQSGVNFNWQLSGGGTVLPNNNLAAINWTTPGTHTITVTPSNSCGTGQAKSRLIFVKNTNAQITQITGEDEPCITIENYNVPSISGLTYDWNVTGGGTITELGNSAFVDWGNTGIYTLSVSTSDGCTNSLTVSVDDVPTQPSPIFGDTTVCLSFYNYSILNAPNVNYTWTLSGGGILTQSGNAANVNWTQTGNYTLIATPSNDCGLGTPRSQTITVLDVPNQPSTITTTAANDTLSCLTTETYSVNSQSNVNYNFSLSGNGLLVQNQNSAAITWQTASVDNELIVTSSNICGTSGQQNLNIDVLDIPQVAPIQGDNEVCINTNQTYVVPLIAENTYNWNLSSGGILTVTNDTAFINWQTVGTHTLTVSPVNICGSGQTQILQITVKTVPTQPIGFVGNTNACQTLEGYNVTAENNVTYNWNLSGGGSLVALSNSANINWTVPGTHILTITPNNECGIGTPLNQSISVQNIPTSPSAIVGVDSSCVIASITNNFSTTIQSGNTYTWSLSNGGTLTPNLNTANVNWTGIGNHILSVSATNTCGTSIPTTKTITVLDIPTQVMISGATDVCLNDTETYIATGDATNYIWTATGGTVNGNQITWTATGAQVANLIATNSCGSALIPLFQVVNVSTIPNISQSIIGDSVVCPGILSYSLPQITDVNYTWSISGGGTIQALNSSVNINWITPGTYTLTAIPSNDCGNGNTIIKQITVRDIPNTPTAIQGLDSICTVQGTYIIAPENGVTYNWNLGSGGIVSNLGNGAISILWTNEGTHTITVTPVNVCGIQGTPVTKTVTVLIPPQLAGDIFGAAQVCNGETESYLLSGFADWNYNWTIDNGNSVTINNNQVVIDFNTIGTTTLSVAVGNQCGIAPTKTIEIIVEDNAPTLTSDISGDTLVCRNSDVVYSVESNPDFDYNWTLNSGGNLSTLGNSSIVTWQTAGTYDLGVYTSNFCGTGDTVFTNVTVENPLPRPQIILNNDTLFSSNSSASQWYFNNEPLDNATLPYIRAVSQGVYTVESENICGVTPLSNEFAFGLEGGLFLYPNPGRYYITLRVPEYLTWYSVDAIDQLGREALQPILYNGSNEVLIDVRTLDGGVYWFRIDTELITLYRKVVILD